MAWSTHCDGEISSSILDLGGLAWSIRGGSSTILDLGGGVAHSVH